MATREDQKPALENDRFQFFIHPERGAWSLSPKIDGSIAIQEAGIIAHYRSSGTRRRALQDWPSPLVTVQEAVPSPQGPMQQMQLALGPDISGMRFLLTFALPELHPLFLWKLSVENAGPQPARIDRFELLNAGMRSPGLVFPSPARGLAFFSNGWQSWSWTGVFGFDERPPHSRLGPFRSPVDFKSETRRPRSQGHFQAEMFGVLGDRHLRVGVLAGFLSQKHHFGSLEARLSAAHPSLRLWANGDQTRLDPGARMETDWACLQFVNLDGADPLAPYLEAVARQHDLTSRPFLETDPPAGWCSWYQYSSPQYTGTVTPEDLKSNLEALSNSPAPLPLQIFQIDDGFQAKVGDWFSFAPAFPDGVEGLSADIRRAGRNPGLWLAPFIVQPQSRLAAEHPDWLLGGRYRRRANAGFFWNSFAAALDLTHPDALAYAAEVVRRAVHEWGFSYLKLDFLYAAALPGKRADDTRTRAQILRRGLEALRAAAGESTFLLGCGCPLGPAVGLVDAMRIGTDTHWTWYPEVNGRQAFVRDEPDLPAVRNACQNALTRAGLHRRWWINDPDCLLLRKETPLTDVEVQTAATVIALTGGSFMLSDDLAALPPVRIRIAQSLLPLIGEAPRLLDWFDARTPSRLRLDLRAAAGSWHLVSLINWNDEPQDATVNLREFGFDPQETYLVSEFWSQKCQLVRRGKLLRERIAPHGTLLFAVRALDPHSPALAGSDLHISQGLEIARWEAGPNRLALTVERPSPSSGRLALYLPVQPRQVLLNGLALSWESHPDGIYLFPVHAVRSAVLEASW